MLYPEIIHHGAVTGVTGSCHQLRMDESNSLLIDCGLFQGSETSTGGGRGAHDLGIDFPIADIKVLIVTHVHMDHVGRIPYLLAAGFKGSILCTEPSAVLLPLVLEDAFKLSFSRDQSKVERYLRLIKKRTVALPYNHWFSLVDTSELHCKVRLQRAGHVLGSAYVECDLQYPATSKQRRIVFSGDLGAPHTPLLRPPKSPERADVLVLESTYGDRIHEDRSTRQVRLEAVIDRALEDHGTILIPAFSLGRTQELLYEIEDILHRKKLISPDLAQKQSTNISAEQPLPVDWPQLPIILDSPLAGRITSAYRTLNDYWDDEASERLKSGRKPLRFEQLLTIETHQQHLKTLNYLTSTGRPAIVIAGNGMCSSGRIVNYLKAMLGDKRHHVLFVGYQAKGTPGAAIQRFGQEGGYVDLDGERFEIRAGITSLGGYSAHADQRGLVEFVTGMAQWPGEVRLVHGEEGAKRVLGEVLVERYGAKERQVSLVLPV